MITAGRLPLAFGKARTAPMPSPYLIMVGVMPVDFFVATNSSGVRDENDLAPSLALRAEGSQGEGCRPVRSQRPTAPMVVYRRRATYIPVDGSQRRIVGGRRCNHDRPKD